MTSLLDVGALRSADLSQALLEGVHALDLLVPVHGREASAVETDVGVTPCAIRVILHGSRVDLWRWRVVAAPLNKARNRWRLGGTKGLEEAAVAHANERIATSAVVMVVHAEGIRIDSRSRHRVTVIWLEDIGQRHAVYCTTLNHF